MVVSPTTGRLTVVSSERGGERVRGGVAGAVGYLGEAEVAGTQVVSGESHAPLGEVLHRCLAESPLECSGESRSGEAAEVGEFGHSPRMARVGVDGAERWVETPIGRGLIPAWRLGAQPERSTYGLDQNDVEEPVEDCLLARCGSCQFAGQQADGIMQWVVFGVWQT